MPHGDMAGFLFDQGGAVGVRSVYCIVSLAKSVLPLATKMYGSCLMTKDSQNSLSPEARELIEMINDLAVDFMFWQYENLSTGMKMRLAKVTRSTQRMLDGDVKSS